MKKMKTMLMSAVVLVVVAIGASLAACGGTKINASYNTTTHSINATFKGAKYAAVPTTGKATHYLYIVKKSSETAPTGETNGWTEVDPTHTMMKVGQYAIVAPIAQTSAAVDYTVYVLAETWDMTKTEDTTYTPARAIYTAKVTVPANA